MRRAAISILMLAVLLPATAFASVGYRCGSDRQVRATRCCPAMAKKPAPAPAPHATLNAASCCELSQAEPTKPPAADVQKEAASLAPPAIAVTPLAPAIAPPRREVTFAPRAHAPPEPERPLFASHCALLL
jgi:hypothetical protein